MTIFPLWWESLYLENGHHIKTEPRPQRVNIIFVPSTDWFLNISNSLWWRYQNTLDLRSFTMHGERSQMPGCFEIFISGMLTSASPIHVYTQIRSMVTGHIGARLPWTDNHIETGRRPQTVNITFVPSTDWFLNIPNSSRWRFQNTLDLWSFTMHGERSQMPGCFEIFISGMLTSAGPIHVYTQIRSMVTLHIGARLPWTDKRPQDWGGRPHQWGLHCGNEGYGDNWAAWHDACKLLAWIVAFSYHWLRKNNNICM